jgi:hypothetical protein
MKIAWTRLATWALAAFFVAGGLGNIIAPPSIVADYARWGYPDWFHYVTGSLELATAILLFRPRTLRAGLVLGAFPMAAALVTLLLHREFGHMVAPALVMSLIVFIWLKSWRLRVGVPIPKR